MTRSDLKVINGGKDDHQEAINIQLDWNIEEHRSIWTSHIRTMTLASVLDALNDHANDPMFLLAIPAVEGLYYNTKKDTWAVTRSVFPNSIKSGDELSFNIKTGLLTSEKLEV